MCAALTTTWLLVLGATPNISAPPNISATPSIVGHASIYIHPCHGEDTFVKLTIKLSMLVRERDTLRNTEIGPNHVSLDHLACNDQIAYGSGS